MQNRDIDEEITEARAACATLLAQWAREETATLRAVYNARLAAKKQRLQDLLSERDSRLEEACR